MSDRPFARLAERLGLATVGYRAEGRALGTTVTLMDTRAPDRSASVSISCPLVRPLDLRVSIATGIAAARAKSVEHKLAGDAELDAWVTFKGEGEITRAVALLGEDLRAAMRAVDESAGLQLSDTLVTAFVPASASVEIQEHVLHQVVALRAAVHAATRFVPAAPLFRAALPAFQRHAVELGVEATTCPFGLYGVVEGCSVDVFRFLPMSKHDNVLLVHVGFRSALGGDWLLNSHLGRSLRARLKSVIGTLVDVGPRPGWLRFSTRFRAARGSLRDVHEALGEFDAIASLAKTERAFLNVSHERIITGVRVPDIEHPPDLAAIVRELVNAANRIHGAAPEPVKPVGAPYR